MKGKKQRQKVIPHCYRRNLSSRTLSNSSISQLVQLGSYKKRINDLSRNNRLLATSLQEARIEAAIQSNILQDCTKDCNKILFARLKLNEMAKNLAKFVSDLEEVRDYLNVDLLTVMNNPITHKKKSSYDKVCKEPNVNCIEEVTEESSENEVVATENISAAPDLTQFHKSDDKHSNVLPCNPENNIGVVNQDIEMAPILFTDDSEEKKKKISSKRRSSKMSYDADKGSLTPELNIDLTCIKLKRRSSRRQTQFMLPSSRSTSRGKINSSGNTNSPEELVTPAKPASPPFTQQKQNTTEMKKSVEEIFRSPSHDILEKESRNPRSFPVSHPRLVLDKINPTNFLKTVVAPEVQPAESNHTVLLCEDMELTEVIHPVHQIVFSSPPAAANHNSNLNCGITKETKENGALDFCVETKKNENGEIVSERDSLELPNTPANTSKLHHDDDIIQLPDINEHDEVQNVGILTFCEPNNNDHENGAGRATKSSVIRPCRSKPIEYAVFFSSDESDENSPFKVVTKKGKKSNRKTVICTKTGKSCEKTEDIVSEHKVIIESENEVIKKDISKYTVDVLLSRKKEKNPEKKSKNLKEKQISSKNDLPKQSSEKCLTTSKEGNLKLNKIENVKKLILNPNVSPGSILKKTQSIFESTKEKGNEILLDKAINFDSLEDSIFNAIETPKSESRKVSFAPTDLVCNFGRMSLSKKIAENKKVRRTSKSVLDWDELFEEEAQTKSSRIGADNSSESTNVQKLNNSVLFNFSDTTELYNFQLPPNSNFSSVPTTDDLLLSKFTNSNASQKNVNKNVKHLKIVPPASKPVAVTRKLSLKKKKPKDIELQRIPGEISKDKFNEINALMIDSPVSVSKQVKRKSLFKEHLDNSKENIDYDHQILEKTKNISQETVKKSTSTKCPSKSQERASIKKLSGKPKLAEPTPEMKKKRKSVAVKCHNLATSPVLKDTVNLPDAQDEIPAKRRSKQISYREPSLHKKLRRE